MGINFGDNTTTAPAIKEVSTPQGMTLDMSKGATLDLTKRNPGLKKVVLAAGWDISASGSNFDLDISAFLLGANGKVSSQSNVCYFGNDTASGLHLNGDNLTGEGEGDDETMDIDLSAVPADVESIVFAVTIYDAVTRRQTFGMVNNSYVRLLDANSNNKEVCRFRLKDDYSTSTAVIFAKLKRNSGEWEFEAIGEGKQADINGVFAIYS